MAPSVYRSQVSYSPLRASPHSSCTGPVEGRVLRHRTSELRRIRRPRRVDELEERVPFGRGQYGEPVHRFGSLARDDDTNVIDIGDVVKSDAAPRTKQ